MLLCRRPAATAPFQTLAWEFPYATGVAIQRKKEEEEKIHTHTNTHTHTHAHTHKEIVKNSTDKLKWNTKY